MTANNIIKKVELLGATLAVFDGKLQGRNLKVLDDEIRSQVRQHKDEIIALLTKGQGQNNFLDEIEKMNFQENSKTNASGGETKEVCKTCQRPEREWVEQWGLLDLLRECPEGVWH